jgi:CubicO group peptidase (beta-lactamase class C family)
MSSSPHDERHSSERIAALLARARTPEEVARAIIDAGVSKACAAGWARVDGAQVHTAVGGALAPDAPGDLAGDLGGVPLDAGGGGIPPADVIFDLASLTKPMLAVSLARRPQLVQARLHEVLAEAAGTGCADATLERLLSHRAGLEANLPLYRRLLDGAPSRADLFAEAANALRAERFPESADGFAPLYSDLGYVLVGEGAARALDQEDAGIVIRDGIVRPLGLDALLGTVRELAAAGVDVRRRTAPTEDVPWRGGVVRGEVHDENAWMLTGAGGSGHAGVFGTAAAVLTFGRDVLGRLDELAWTWRPRAGGTLRAGFDGKSETGSSAGSVLGPRTFGHLGFTGTSVWIDPDAKIVVTLLTNRVYPTRENPLLRIARPLAHDALARSAMRSAHD